MDLVVCRRQPFVNLSDCLALHHTACFCHMNKMQTQWRNNNRIYGSVSRIAHWLTAVLVLPLIASGLSDHCGIAWPFKLAATVNCLILVLTVLRLGWRVHNPAPPLPPLINSAEKTASRFSHITFYALLILLPLLNLQLCFSDHPSSFLSNLRLVLNMALIALVILHIAAVFYYRKTRKLNLMYRIWPVLKKQPARSAPKNPA